MIWQVFIIYTLFECVCALQFIDNACTNVVDYHVTAFSTSCSYNPDVSSTITNIVTRHGYKIKKYNVTTNDGYILNLFRISSPKVSVKKYPIFVLHGIAINAESWVATGNKSLAFNLVEQSYDVWIGTIRGTTNANKHSTLAINNPEYWNYTLDTLAKEDVSTQVSFVANKTKEKVLIVAHSMGTTLSFMYTSEFANAENVVKGVVALAPVAYLNGAFLIEFIRPVALAIIDYLNRLNRTSILTPELVVHHVVIKICKAVPEICYAIMSSIPGKTEQFPPEDLLLFLSYWGSGTSIFQLKHFLQIAGSKRFQKFDYGSKENLKVYGSKTPPVYNLSNIKVPVCLFYGKNDVFYTKQNMQRLYNELGSSVKHTTGVPVNQKSKYNFAHLDFVDSKNIVKFLYDDLFAKMKLYFG